MELQKYGVEEITSKEKMELTGGTLWEEIMIMWDMTPENGSSMWQNMGNYWLQIY